jgi:hypothetical protein
VQEGLYTYVLFISVGSLHKNLMERFRMFIGVLRLCVSKLGNSSSNQQPNNVRP